MFLDVNDAIFLIAKSFSRIEPKHDRNRKKTNREIASITNICGFSANEVMSDIYLR